ncbi:Metallo-beta-lactamase superfamily, putative [Leishmania donovani]|uniref:hydroxyacylglutathione hydrolase n=1 Tax=Leishmania donovani TaxID=5661 RepID=A0A3S7X8A7_LEIDO|nr:Metallo-beta-lactamase superfamily, putative [Leishmania donovani]
MSILLSWMGPMTVAASVAYAYAANHPSAAQLESGSAYPFPLTTLRYCGLLFLVYASGTMPRNPFFPSFVFRSNIFPLLYKMYCSYTIGYRVLRPFMHKPVAYPHSDYRIGIRCIDAGSPLRLKPVTTGTAPFLTRFYARAGGVVDAALWTGSVVRGVAVVPIPIFGDNYAYLIVSMQTHKVAAVDPADPETVLRIMESLRAQLRVPLQLTEVLTTHKHWDHAGGNELLATLSKKEVPVPPHEEVGVDCAPNMPLLHPKLRFIGSEEDAPLCCDVLVSDASPVFEIMGGAAKVQAMAAPGHTKGSLVFVVGSAEEGVLTATPARVAVFTGDSLFCGGCGAPFETVSVAQIMKARATFLEDPRMRAQPGTGQEVAEEDVLLYVGHEYTERLLAEVVTLMTRVTTRSRTPSDPRGKEYLRAVADALDGVKMLRTESDELTDAARMGCEADRQKPQVLLPSCTVPSSLAVEKVVNPLLTVDDEVLTALKEAEKHGPMDSNEVERAIYCSDRRRLPASAT